MRNFVQPIAATALMSIVAASGAFGTAQAQAQTALAAQVDLLPPFPTILREVAASDALVEDGIKEFYTKRNYLPVWIGSDARREDLRAAVTWAATHGLSSEAYSIDAAEALLAGSTTEQERAEAELLFARIFVDLARDLNTGVLNPRKVYRANFYRPEVKPAQELLQRGASASDVFAYLDSLTPKTSEYEALRTEMQRLEAIIAAGDYGASIPANRLMRPGYNGERTVLVRNRLRALGYGELGESTVYDEDLVAVVKTFQTDQRLKPDGVLGPATIGALNASASDRLEQVVMNMERQRWINKPLGDRHIRVNIADFSMAVYDYDVATFRSKVVVGKSIWDQQTPEFTDEMTHMVINPYWHVPKSIAQKEYLPMLQQDPLALARRGLLLLNRRGQVLNTEGADFSVYSQGNFPFSIKQPPGGGNALGRVKFMFPNKHNIYLHDTPAKRLFGRERRAYSHGCVRVERPFDLAYHLLSPQTDEPEGTFHSILKTGRERQVNLETSIPIYLTYNTAFVGEDGSIVYRTDVYGRDKAMLKALRDQGILTTLDG